MVISCNTCQRNKKECTWVKYVIYGVLTQFKCCRTLSICFAKYLFSELTKKNGYCNSWWHSAVWYVVLYIIVGGIVQCYRWCSTV